MDEIIEMMETLLDEYGNQDKQLNKMHATLVVLEYGYNSLRQQLSGAECSVSQVLELSRSIADELTQGVESKLVEVTSCIDNAESTLESVKRTTHPCGEGDWELIVDEDYSVEGGDDCPNGWVQFTEAITGRQLCGGESVGGSSVDPFCDSAMFDPGMEYRKICGSVVGYGIGNNVGFFINNMDDIDAEYVDGVSLTHGTGPRNHIWTFAIGVVEDSMGLTPGLEPALCPCHPDFPALAFIPTFIEGDYFCESGVALESDISLNHYMDDPLWDGRLCEEICCNSSPYFVKALETPTSNQLEIRICNNEESGQNNAIEKIKIFVQ